MAKMKLQARLSEGQATIEQLGLKLQQLEKAKAKAAADAADMAQQLDQAQILNAAMEKKAKQFDRIVGEWKHKVWTSILFIGPESDHWLCLSVTHSLTDYCLVNFMPVNDASCLMMSQQLLKAVDRLFTLERSCVGCLHILRKID